KAANAQTTANQAKTAAATAQSTADTAKSDAATADAKAVAAQTSANAANTAAKNADTKAANAQTTANQAKTAAATAQSTADTAKSDAATADAKAVAAQTSANAANTAAKNADTKAANAQTTANQAKTAAATAQSTADTAKSAAATADGKAVAAQTKASQVPNPVANNFVVGNTATAYKLMTAEQVKTLLGVPAASKLYSVTGQAIDGAMTQKAVTDEFDKIYKRSYKDETANRKSTVTYTNPTDQEIWVFVESDGGWNITTILTAAVNGIEFIISSHNSTNNNVNAGCFAVPARAKYAVAASNTITRWTEYKKQ
ncbi:MAG: hypothetical protein ACRCXK_13690, partial [Wohlfahrtiimonas sp.]